MNKYEKALNDLKHGTGGAEALEVAMEALEKQIPAKPKLFNDDKNLPVCPTCGVFLLYMHGCGNNKCNQRIDWSEVE